MSIDFGNVQHMALLEGHLDGDDPIADDLIDGSADSLAEYFQTEAPTGNRFLAVARC